ncbi:MAG: hypothetical protein HY329_15090, partial [Chloroflexi bacterium]|nr:hypothetical protein [Chloroflexota bacterium]
QAFVRTLEAATVGFHLGGEVTTIDLDRGELSPTDQTVAEALANEIVFANRPVRTHWTTLEEIERFGLRKPPVKTGAIRIVEVAEFDRSACGGTHPATTGQIGLVKIVGTERVRGGTRVQFVCGSRALAAFQRSSFVSRELVAALRVAEPELPAAVDRLAQRVRVAEKSLQDARTQLLAHEAAALRAAAQPVGSTRLVQHCFVDRAVDELRQLAQKLTAEPGTVAILGSQADRAHLVVARSSDLDVDLRPSLSAALTTIGGRGGGAPGLAQGSGAGRGALPEALEQATRAVTVLLLARDSEIAGDRDNSSF